MPNFAKNISIIFICMISFYGFGQQEPLYSLYWKNYSTYNPAHTGDRYKLYSNIQYRKPWIDLPVIVNTANAVLEYRIDPDHHALGLVYAYDEIGRGQSHKINLNYSYAISLASGRLSFGVAPTIKLSQRAQGWITPGQQSGFSPIQTVNSTLFDLNSGISFTTDNLSTGLSLVNILGSSDFDFSNQPHLFTHIDYKFIIHNSYSLTTRYYLRSDFNITQNELSIVNTFFDSYMLGASFRTGVSFGSGIGVMAGIRLFNKIEANYQYEFSPSSFISPGPSHEIGISFYLD